VSEKALVENVGLMAVSGFSRGGSARYTGSSHRVKKWMEMSKALSIRNLKKTYDNGFEALKGINLDVQEGDFFALLGPNGAGKSTTIGIITSLINKTAGEVSVCGYDLDKDTTRAKSQLGLVPQEFNFNVFEPVVEIVVNQGGYYGIDRKTAYKSAEYYLRQLGLWEKRSEMARNLSGGMKRRLMIARALVHNPRVLILDEPTAGVDIEIRRSMWKFLKELNAKGTTIILTTHYLEEAESLCRNIAIIDKGELIENTSMRNLLNQLDMETFVLDLSKPIPGLQQIPGYDFHVLDDCTLEVEVSKSKSLNALFSELSAKGIDVVSMRNKTNRLEQLFMHLVDANANMIEGGK
jgi:ABC-2 type transport system ATP-binding protein